MTTKENQEIKEILKKHEKRLATLENLFKSEEKLIKKPISIKEFLLSKNTNNDVQKTLVIGYYLEKYENKDNFTVKDREEGFRNAKETVPSNINDKVNKNIRKGYMDETKVKKGNRSAWYLTNSGEISVETELEK